MSLESVFLFPSVALSTLEDNFQNILFHYGQFTGCLSCSTLTFRSSTLLFYILMKMAEDLY